MTIIDWGLGHDDMPTYGGQKPHVIATITLAELQVRVGAAYLNNGEPVSIERAVQLMCDADASLAVFSGTGEHLHYGRDRRTAPDRLRRALIARDSGCTVDGCDAPPEQCQAHHVDRWYRDDAPTDIDTMTLDCKRHHTMIHQDTIEIRMINGRPTVIPPKWIDPEQRPRFNHRHRPPPLGP